VLADAFIVRLTLIPAVMALLGRSAWKLPRRLERIVPEVDIEGEQLVKGLAHARPETA
jgi:RND superfamily putative drug exporter